MKTSKRNILKPIFGLMILFLFTGNLFSQTREQQDLIDDAVQAKRAFIENSENLSQLFDTAAGYAIFPNVGKGAYILGGAAGNGVVYQDDEIIGFAELKQLDIGLQLGGQAYQQVILFQTQEKLDEFKSDDFSLSSNASAVILEKGEAKSVEFGNGRAIATLPKAGAMIEMSVGGQRFDYRDKDF